MTRIAPVPFPALQKAAETPMDFARLERANPVVDVCVKNGNYWNQRPTDGRNNRLAKWAARSNLPPGQGDIARVVTEGSLPGVQGSKGRQVAPYCKERGVCPCTTGCCYWGGPQQIEGSREIQHGPGDLDTQLPEELRKYPDPRGPTASAAAARVDAVLLAIRSWGKVTLRLCVMCLRVWCHAWIARCSLSCRVQTIRHPQGCAQHCLGTTAACTQPHRCCWRDALWDGDQPSPFTRPPNTRQHLCPCSCTAPLGLLYLPETNTFSPLT